MTKGIQRSGKKWEAYFHYDGVKVVVGHYKTKEEAKLELSKAMKQGNVE